MSRKRGGKRPPPPRPSRSTTGKKRVVYSAYITRNGKRIYASQYGLKAFRFEIDD